MGHGIYKVLRFQIVGPYKLTLVFDDGAERTIDLRPVLAGELYGALQDISAFNKVRIDEEAGTLVWPNGADFDPETLHEWPRYVEALIARARKWESLTV
jgi:hypothetical protein